MERSARAALLKNHPERYATTGLDWSNRSHYPDIANGLFQALMAVLASQQGVRDESHRRLLRIQQARVEQRLSVVERAAWRHGLQILPPIADVQVIYALEKMADAFEIGAPFHLKSREPGGSNVFPGTMLGIGVGFAAAVRGHRAIKRFSVGPFGALSKLAGLVTRPDLQLEMEDLPALSELVAKARDIPVGHVVLSENETCADFYAAFDALMARAQERAGRAD